MYFLTEDDQPFQQHVLSVVVGTYIAFTILQVLHAQSSIIDHQRDWNLNLSNLARWMETMSVLTDRPSVEMWGLIV